MAVVLHLFKSAPSDLARATITEQLRQGDRVTLVVLEGAGANVDGPAGVTVRRVPDDLSYDTLLETMFEADQVIAW